MSEPRKLLALNMKWEKHYFYIRCKPLPSSALTTTLSFNFQLSPVCQALFACPWNAHPHSDTGISLILYHLPCGCNTSSDTDTPSPARILAALLWSPCSLLYCDPQGEPPTPFCLLSLETPVGRVSDPTGPCFSLRGHLSVLCSGRILYLHIQDHWLAFGSIYSTPVPFYLFLIMFLISEHFSSSCSFTGRLILLFLCHGPWTLHEEQ